jgi:hypothetical protein
MDLFDKMDAFGVPIILVFLALMGMGLATAGNILLLLSGLEYSLRLYGFILAENGFLILALSYLLHRWHKKHLARTGLATI